MFLLMLGKFFRMLHLVCLDAKESRKLKLFQDNKLRIEMPKNVSSTVMFGNTLAKGLVGRGFTRITLLVKLMSPIKFFRTVIKKEKRNFTFFHLLQQNKDVLCDQQNK